MNRSRLFPSHIYEFPTSSPRDLHEERAGGPKTSVHEHARVDHLHQCWPMRRGHLDSMVARRPTDRALHTGSTGLVYLIHGVTGSPTEMRYLAKGLAGRGWDVYVTTLPGHCTQVRDLVKTSEQQWQEHVVAQLSWARPRYDVVFVAGLSAGALLALDAATVVNVNGVGVMSPSFVYDGWNRPWSHTILPFAMKRIPLAWQHLLFHVAGPPFGVKDDVLQTRLRAAYSPVTILRDWFRGRQTSDHAGRAKPPATPGRYPVFPLKTLTELDRLSTRVRARLSDVRAPVLTLQAVDDDRTSSRNAFIVHDEIGSVEKQLVLLNDSFHVITVDKQRQEVVRHLGEFFQAHVPSWMQPPRERSSRSAKAVVGTRIRRNAGRLMCSLPGREFDGRAPGGDSGPSLPASERLQEANDFKMRSTAMKSLAGVRPHM